MQIHKDISDPEKPFNEKNETDYWKFNDMIEKESFTDFQLQNKEHREELEQLSKKNRSRR